MILVLEKQFTAFENLRKDLLKKLEGLSEEQQNYKSDPNTWSLNEVVEHLILSQSGTLKYMQKKLPHAESAPPTGFASKFASFSLRLALRSPIKFKLPQKANVNPGGEKDFSTLKEEWDEVADSFRNLLDQIDVKTANKLLFRHPRAGLINVKQTLQFLMDHFQHHQPQVDRIIKHPGFPKG